MLFILVVSGCFFFTGRQYSSLHLLSKAVGWQPLTDNEKRLVDTDNSVISIIIVIIIVVSVWHYLCQFTIK